MGEEEECSCEEGAPVWMATFSDMATLLLTFFVMIVAMSEVEVQKFQAALSYFQGNTGVLNELAVTPPSRDFIILEKQEKVRQQVDRYEQLLDYLKENDLQNKVQVNLSEQGLHVIITDSIMFLSGHAELLEGSRNLLAEVAGVLGSEVQSVVVEGHTDNDPISTGRFPSNWELSAARSSAVVRHLLTLKSALEPGRYLATGYGEYRPIDTNETPAGRSRNRRVEILFSWEQWQTITQQQQP
jgi:chemotaxis protein MotB